VQSVPLQWVPPLVVPRAAVPVARQRPPVQVSAFQQQQVLAPVLLQLRVPALVEQLQSVQIPAVQRSPLQARVISPLMTA
jgi:hypothetical protein